MKWILQLVAALALGVIFAVIFAFLGSWILTLLNVQTISRDPETLMHVDPIELWERAQRAFLSGIFGFAVGSAVGVALVGKRRGISGSFGLAFIWCVISGGIAVFIALGPADEPWGTLATLLIFLSPVTAMVGYNLPLIWRGNG
jgi:hypothetical protein